MKAVYFNENNEIKIIFQCEDYTDIFFDIFYNDDVILSYIGDVYKKIYEENGNSYGIKDREAKTMDGFSKAVIERLNRLEA